MRFNMENLNNDTPNILIVDDVNAHLVMMTEIIKKAGYIARPVTSAHQALLAIKALTPDLILTDVSMSGMNGLEFCSLVKKNPLTCDIPIIFISGLTSVEDRIKGLKAGAVDYIVKPYSIEEVTLRINLHIKISRMQKDKQSYNRKLHTVINDQINKIYEEQRNIIYAMAKISAIRDGNTGKHLINVSKGSRLLAISLQILPIYEKEVTKQFIDTIELAAPLHDIGKILIQDSILLKESSLDTNEKKIMETHTVIGANLLEEVYSYSKNNDYLKMAIDIAMYHHEKWDGTGYPKGLAGDNIPLSARIVSVVNTYDILASTRCYKPAYSHEKCMEIINSQAGIRFDPQIVENFNKIQNQIKRYRN